ncbi:hypothetical protein [uncultured Methanobrevibacter sp.]|uniref:hypothetical protein n=1 Tax=uncultured Methanobrevibacter sp. TaxID=253161 RepID=UPI0025F861D9|nr:hypothetical protein [uncultured Methanobrevibacter sp.]
MIILENNFGKIRCPYCDSVFKLEKGDLTQCSQDPEVYYFECPICYERKYFEDDVFEHSSYIRLHKYGMVPHK